MSVSLTVAIEAGRLKFENDSAGHQKQTFITGLPFFENRAEASRAPRFDHSSMDVSGCILASLDAGHLCRHDVISTFMFYSGAYDHESLNGH
jgi:hypothetical protein